MSDYSCLKVRQLNYLIDIMNKIKNIIKKCNEAKIDKIDPLSIIEIEKKKLTKELDKKLNLVKNRYDLLHSKLYNILDIIINCECSNSKKNNCKKDSLCLKSKENEELWLERDNLYEKILKFYQEIKINLILETELCLYRVNKIKKINFY